MLSLFKGKTLNKTIIVALDFSSLENALTCLDKLDPTLCRVKIGKELFTSAGPESVKQATVRGFDVFLDLKFHDIPNTVARAAAVAAEMGVWMLNVHAGGGFKMLAETRAALNLFGKERPLLIGVTLLTSFSPSDLVAVGVSDNPEAHVLRLAQLAKDAGLDGVVCSAREAGLLREKCGEKFCLVTPGIRRNQDENNDQKRVQTPSEAIASGSNFLVMGRPITKAKDPMEVIRSIYGSI